LSFYVFFILSLQISRISQRNKKGHIWTCKKKRKNKKIFLEDINDDVIINSKIDIYIENIKKDNFYGGIIEISIFAKLQNINISVYTIDTNNPNFYIHFMNIFKNDNINSILLMEFENRNHFIIYKLKTTKIIKIINQIYIKRNNMK